MVEHVLCRAVVTAHVADAHVCYAGCDAPDLSQRCTKARPKKEPPELHRARVCARAPSLSAPFAWLLLRYAIVLGILKFNISEIPSGSVHFL